MNYRNNLKILGILCLFLIPGLFSGCQNLLGEFSTSASNLSSYQAVVVYETSENQVTLPPLNTPTITPTPPIYTPYVQPENPTPTATAPIIGFGNFPENYNPLTGLELEDWGVINRRPIIVKVSNYPRFGRPHAGLSNADIVFDYYIGYGENRFAALFYQSDSEIVGPMRSGRLVDGQLGRLYQAAVFYRSADPDVEQVIVDRLGDRAIGDADCPEVCNVGAYSVTSTFGNTLEMTNYLFENQINNQKPNLSGMFFDPRPLEEGESINKIGIQFGKEDRAEWVYNGQNGVYDRWIEASATTPFEMIPLVDRNTTSQIFSTNVLIIFAEYETFKPTLHDIHLWDNFSGQKAFYFRDGRMIEGTWRAVSQDRPLQFLDTYRRNYALKPGNTWIIIMDPHSEISRIDDQTIDFIFKLPEE